MQGGSYLVCMARVCQLRRGAAWRGVAWRGLLGSRQRVHPCGVTCHPALVSAGYTCKPSVSVIAAPAVSCCIPMSTAPLRPPTSASRAPPPPHALTRACAHTGAGHLCAGQGQEPGSEAAGRESRQRQQQGLGRGCVCSPARTPHQSIVVRRAAQQVPGACTQRLGVLSCPVF